MGRYGWIPDRPDQRDYLLPLPITPRKLAVSADNETLAPPIWDQDGIGACTSFGTLAVCAISEKHDAIVSPQVVAPSQLFTYYCTRMLEGTELSDAGASIRDTIKAIARFGIAADTTWPFVPSQFAKQPPPEAYNNAKHQRAMQYARVPQNLYALKYPLSLGYGVSIGISVYESFESKQVAADGMVPMPEVGEQFKGGHCMCLLGYRDDLQRFKVRNSWTKHWGDHGHCWIPYEYLTDRYLASDFWTVKHVN